jgi:hypothetical protein
MTTQRDKLVRSIGTRAKKKWPVGARYGKLVVVGHERQPNGCWAVLCECDCGRDKKVLYPNQMARGLVQSCGCLNRELSSLRRKGKAPACTLAPGEASFNFMLRQYKRAALLRDFDFKLTDGEFRILTQQPCAYCGKPPTTGYKTNHYNGVYIANGLDRVDPNKGYTIENTVPCCKQCNRAKRDLSLDEFLTWLIRVSKHLSL